MKFLWISSESLRPQETQHEDGFSKLHVAADYKHLGAKFAERASMENEVLHRLAAAQQAYAMLRRPIFANRRIPTHTRLQLLDALILPRLSLWVWEAAHAHSRTVSQNSMRQLQDGAARSQAMAFGS